MAISNFLFAIKGMTLVKRKCFM